MVGFGIVFVLLVLTIYGTLFFNLRFGGSNTLFLFITKKYQSIHIFTNLKVGRQILPIFKKV